MAAAKAEAERYGARDRARTVYGRALALQTQADELWEHETYRQAGQVYAEASRAFVDSCDLAYQQTLKEEAEESRGQVFTAREAATAVGAAALAAAPFREAAENERRADTAMGRAEFTQARELYALVRQLYERAAREAGQGREQPAVAGDRAPEKTHQGAFTLQAETGDLTRWGQPPENPAAEPTRWEKLPVISPAGNMEEPLDLGPTMQTPVPGTPAEADEDHWEIGEKAQAPQAADFRPPAAARPRRMKPALIGVAAVGVLATFAWFAGSLYRRPPAPLTLVRAEPQTEAVQVAEGNDLAFAAEAQGDGPLRYEWTLAGRRISQEKKWRYKPTVSEGGGEPKTVQLLVSDQAGQRVEKRWRVTVTHTNHPPQIVTIAPSGESLELAAGAAQEFRVEATDPDDDPLTYEWTVDGVAAGTQPTFTWKAQGEGRHQVRAVVRDRENLTVTREWQVAALRPPPEKVVPAKSTPPRIVQRIPEESALTVQRGTTQDFAVSASDQENDELAYAWAVDGKKAGKDPHFAFTAGDTGKHRVEVEVADRGGLKDRVRWEVDVPAPPAAPRLVMFTPHQAEFSLFPHQSRFFGVEVDVPGVVEPELNYQWKIDGRPVPGQEVVEFKNKPVGAHKVEVVVTASSGLSVTSQWTVMVRKEEGEDLQPPTLAPVLQVFDLDNTTSKDKKIITISGKVRNVDEKSAENVLVTISAVGADGQPVSRRVVLPSPQPLPGGGTATFQFAIANHETISDFRVEVVSK